jgi:hypothetical protein
MGKSIGRRRTLSFLCGGAPRFVKRHHTLYHCPYLLSSRDTPVQSFHRTPTPCICPLLATPAPPPPPATTPAVSGDIHHRLSPTKPLHSPICRSLCRLGHARAPMRATRPYPVTSPRARSPSYSRAAVPPAAPHRRSRPLPPAHTAIPRQPQLPPTPG